MNPIKLLFLISIIASCNGGGGGGGGVTQVISGSSLVMVDPYIEGATMCYDENENNQCDDGEPESSPSDSKGNTKFAINLPANVKLIQKEKGLSLGKPFLGTLKAQYDPEFKYVTPITTLLANGVDEEDLKDALGLDDLKVNPMAAIEEGNEQKLGALKASMAISALLASEPNLSVINTVTLDQKISNIDQVFSGQDLNLTTLKAAVIIQEFISFNDVASVSAVVESVKTAIENPTNSGKEIKLTGVTTNDVEVNTVASPSIVRTANFSSLQREPKIFKLTPFSVGGQFLFLTFKTLKKLNLVNRQILIVKSNINPQMKL